MLTVVPTDRDKRSPDLGVGVDTIAVAGRTTESLLQELRHQRLDRQVDRQTGEIVETPTLSSLSMEVGSGWVRLHGYRQQGQAMLRAELSLPKMLHGHNSKAVPRTLLPDAVDAALSSLAYDLPDVPNVEQVAVQRLDLARDFHGVSSVPATLAALALRDVPHARVNQRYHRPDGRLQCLERGSSREYLIRGYDKCFELSTSAKRARDPMRKAMLLAEVRPGHLRYELELRAPLLRRKGFFTVTDCSPERLETMAHDYYVKARWATPYGSRTRVLEAIEQLKPTLSRATYRHLLLYVFCTENGMEPPLDRHAVEAVRPIVRRHELLDVADDLGQRRLDFETGRELEAE